MTTTVTYICSNCPTKAILPSGKLPKGWEMPLAPLDTGRAADAYLPPYSVIALCSKRCLEEAQEASKRKSTGRLQDRHRGARR